MVIFNFNVLPNIVANKLVAESNYLFRPQELDEAARRRFAKRLYIALPETEARASIVRTLLHGMSHNLEDRDFETTAELTQGSDGHFVVS